MQALVDELELAQASLLQHGPGHGRGVPAGSGGAGGGVQQASAVVAKALARVVKLSRENDGLARLNAQLAAELSSSSGVHVDLQARIKLLYALSAEVRCGCAWR